MKIMAIEDTVWKMRVWKMWPEDMGMKDADMEDVAIEPKLFAYENGY